MKKKKWISLFSLSIIIMLIAAYPLLGENIDGIVVDSNGNVGIGTTTPSEKLHVKGGDIGLDEYQTLNWVGFPYLRHEASNNLSIGKKVGSARPWIRFMNQQMRFYDGRKMVIEINEDGPLDLSPATDTVITSGNLGIGTTNFGSGATNVVMLGNGSPSSGVQDAAFIYAGGGVMWVGDQDGDTNLITPHPSEDIETLADPKDPYPLFEKCSNRYIGKEIVVDKGKAFRLLQTLFPDEEFIWYREVPRVDPVAAQREWWKRKWIRENTREVEITKSEAFETVTVDVEDKTSIVGEQVRYRLEGEDVIEVRKPVYAKRTIEKRELREGVRFCTETGRFFETVVPTEQEAEVAAGTEFEAELSQWVWDRM